MKITSSYKVLLRHISDKTLEPTVKIFSSYVSDVVKVCDENYETLSSIQGNLRRHNCVEKLIHSTKNNQAYYDLDQKYPRFPSYLRRSAIQIAIGHVFSYRSNLKNWEEENPEERGEAPSLPNSFQNEMPVFYNGASYENTGTYTAKIKLYINGIWQWQEISFRKTDIDYLKKHWTGRDMSAPKLERHYGKWYLRFAFEENVKLFDDSDTNNVKICAVDLGLNTDAVCVIMDKDGTVSARKFIDFPDEKARLYTVLNRIRKFQKEHGSHDVGSRWGYAKRLNEEIAKKTANAITDFAENHDADVIVFEYLETSGKKRGAKKQRLHMWKKNSIQKLAEHDAHRKGIRISRVCAWGTSKFAYDGSGEVLRGQSAGLQSYSLCKFQNGKIYNSDLSASYNIGARYYIRATLKNLSESERSCIQAEVPECRRRTSCTLQTLWQIRKAMASRTAQPPYDDKSYHVLEEMLFGASSGAMADSMAGSLI